MSEQSQNPQDLRQALLDQIEESKKALTELSEEELENVAGGFSFASIRTALKGKKMNIAMTGMMTVSMIPTGGGGSTGGTQQ